MSFFAMQKLIAAAGEVTGVSRVEILSHRRDSRSVYARRLCCWVARESLVMSYPRIGHYLRRDHTTVMHGADAVNRLIEQEGADGRTYADLRHIIERMAKVTAFPIRPLDFIEEMRLTEPRERAELLRDGVIWLGGAWITPILGYGDHEYSVSLFGISATASSLDELCLNWLRCAMRIYPNQIEQSPLNSMETLS